tara:strand:+ start:166 stop:444 length:279 start_codon:yes stop_codon:yes gene_type:complete
MQNHINNEAAVERLAGMVRYEVAKVLGEHTQDLNDRIDELEAELREAHGEAVDLSEAFELEAEHAHDLQARLAESQNDYQSLLYAAEHGVVS